MEEDVKQQEDSSTSNDVKEVSSTSDVEEVSSASDQKEEGQFVPYARFKEVIDERNNLRERLEKLEEEISYYTSGKKETSTTEPTEEEFDWENPTQAVEKIVRNLLYKEVPKITTFEIQRKQASAEALQLFPDLANPDSEFFKKTADCFYRLGLDKHPEGVKVAAFYVAGSQFPQALSRISKAEEQRKSNLVFIEGSKSKADEEVFTLPPDQEDFLRKMGLNKEQINEAAKNLAAKVKGGR